jgi:hypothetical protein
MSNFTKKVWGTVFLVCLVLQACSSQAPVPNNEPSSSVGTTPSQAIAIDATEVHQPTQVSTQASAIIQHLVQPGDPKYIDTQIIHDCTLGYTYALGQPAKVIKSCDAWKINILERPMAAGTNNYLPFLDIESAQFGADTDWYYGKVRIYESGLPTEDSPLYYLFELDTDFNGRGDFLLSVQDLPMNQITWTVNGVRVWQDINGDVGSQTAIRADTGSTGDGYDALLFDQGVASDPDLIWVRRSPAANNTIEFSFKPSLLGGDPSFSWWAWSFLGQLDPAKFDIVDTVSDAYQLDNTCTLGFNGDPIGFPNQCKTFQPSPTPPPASNPLTGCVKPPRPNPDSCWIWEADKCQWTCYN